MIAKDLTDRHNVINYPLFFPLRLHDHTIVESRCKPTDQSGSGRSDRRYSAGAFRLSGSISANAGDDNDDDNDDDNRDDDDNDDNDDEDDDNDDNDDDNKLCGILIRLLSIFFDD